MSINSYLLQLIYFFSLTANFMHPAMDTWGSYPENAARNTGAGFEHGPKMTLANQFTSPPSWDTKLA